MGYQNSSSTAGQQLTDLQETLLQKFSGMSCQGHFYARLDIFYRKELETTFINSNHIKIGTKTGFKNPKDWSDVHNKDKYLV